MRIVWNGQRALALAAVAALAGCGGGDSGPSQSPAVIVKTPTKSGDAQSGVVGEALPNGLKVIVTRDGVAVPQVEVTSSTANGSLDPTSSQTDDNGVAGSTWTLGDTPGPQTATAILQDATGSPVTFTATAISGLPQPGTQVQVISGDAGGGANRFSPTDITVNVGTAVTWTWVDEVAAHNVVPDDGATPQTSGPLNVGPRTYSYTFNTLGVFHYHCQAHGSAGGGGMSGTVTVVAVAP